MVKHLYFDKENDILAIHKGFSSDEKFKGNIVAGDLILDMSTKGRVRGIEVLNATPFFKDVGVEEKLIRNLTNADFAATIKPTGFTITLILKTQKDEREVPMKVAVPIQTSFRSQTC